MTAQRTNYTQPADWNLSDSAITPEPMYIRRREFLRVFGLGLAPSAILPPLAYGASAGFPDSLNPMFKLDAVKLTPEELVTSYNNFYEWGLSKDQDDRRNHRSIFQHKLWPGSVIKAGPDLCAAKPLPTRATLRGMSARRRSCSSAIQLAAVRR